VGIALRGLRLRDDGKQKKAASERKRARQRLAQFPRCPDALLFRRDDRGAPPKS
jgi:hypothetical protein